VRQPRQRRAFRARLCHTVRFLRRRAYPPGPPTASEDLQQAVELVGQVGAALAVAQLVERARAIDDLPDRADAASSASSLPVGIRVRPEVRSNRVNVTP
jgi:GAF domain-containing protein